MKENKQKTQNKSIAPRAKAAAEATRPQHNIGKITKTFNDNGRWIERKTKTVICICSCGNRYIKTRPRQAVCLRCMFAPPRR